MKYELNLGSWLIYNCPPTYPELSFLSPPYKSANNLNQQDFPRCVFSRLSTDHLIGWFGWLVASFDWLVESSMWLDFRFFSGESFLVSTVGLGCPQKTLRYRAPLVLAYVAPIATAVCCCMHLRDNNRK